VFSGVPVYGGNTFSRPSAGGGGLGDPLERNPKLVLEDVIDGYVSVVGACRDYGVVIEPIDAEIDEWRIDLPATERERARIRAERGSWLDEDAEQVAERLRKAEITISDAIRRYGVICDWDTGELLARSTEQFRAAMRLRARRL
jgi:N-methylhydantoinase B